MTPAAWTLIIILANTSYGYKPLTIEVDSPAACDKVIKAMQADDWNMYSYCIKTKD